MVEKRDSLVNKRWFLHILSKHKKSLFVLEAVSICQSICVVGIASIVETITNFVYEGHSEGIITGDFAKQAAFLIGLVLLNSIINYMIICLKAKISASSNKKIRTDMLDKIQSLQVDYIENEQAGNIISKLTSDVVKLEQFLNDNIRDIIYLPCNIVLLSVYMLYLDWRLYLSSIAIIPIIMLVSHFINRAVTSLSIQLQTKIGYSTSLVMDAIGGIEVIKAFNLQNKYVKRFEKVTAEIFHKQLSLIMRISSLTPLLFVLRAIPKIACIITGGYLIMEGEVLAGELIAFLLLVGTLSNNIYTLPNIITGYKQADGVVKNLLPLLNAPEEIVGHKEGENISNNINVSLDNIAFGYTEEKEIIKKFSLDIDKPQAVAIVGESGSGKSTIIKMLLGYYFPTKGGISINGTLLTKESLSKCREQMAFVSQETYLFCDTIYNNIACAKENATKEEVYAAAKAANIHDFIMHLEKGYDTEIEERGSNFSGGEKQRLALARALLKQSPIILLDEPTSAVDVESEMKIIKALNEIKKDKIVIIISHRPTTIQIADKICVIKNGEVVEDGTYEDLIGEDTYFKQMYIGTVS